MGKTVLFREFEERDADFIYKCKNDKDLNRLIVGSFHPISYDEARNWVHGCMGEHESYKYWAICTNDDEQRIVGWISLSSIDRVNNSADLHGIVIGDPAYRDGFAWIESYLFIYDYAFEVLKLNRVYGHSRIDHHASQMTHKLFHVTEEGVLRQSVFKDGKYIDVTISSILRSEYLKFKSEGEYEMKSVLQRIKMIKKSNK